MIDSFNAARKIHIDLLNSKIDSYARMSVLTSFGEYLLAAGCWSRSRALALLSVAGADVPSDIRNEILGRLAEEDDERAAEENGLIDDALLFEAEERDREADEYFRAVLRRVETDIASAKAVGFDPLEFMRKLTTG